MSDFISNLNSYAGQKLLIKVENEEPMCYQLDKVQSDCITVSVGNVTKIVPIGKIEYIQTSV